MSKQLRPEILTCLIHTNLWLVSGGSDPDKVSPKFQKWTGVLSCFNPKEFESIDACDDVRICLRWFELDQYARTPSKDDLCYVHGKLFLEPTEDGSLMLSIRAFKVTVYPIPQDLEDVWMPEHTPAKVTCLGRASASQKAPDFRHKTQLGSFTLHTSNYDTSAIDKRFGFDVRCFLENSPRWNSSELPHNDSLLFVSGDLLGCYRTGKSVCPAILLDDLVYLSSSRRADEIQSPAVLQGSEDSEPLTPQKKRRMLFTKQAIPGPSPLGSGKGRASRSDKPTDVVKDRETHPISDRSSSSADKPTVVVQDRETHSISGQSSSRASDLDDLSDVVDLTASSDENQKARALQSDSVAGRSTRRSRRGEGDLRASQLAIPKLQLEPLDDDDSDGEVLDEGINDEEFARIDGMDEGDSDSSSATLPKK